MTRWIDPSPAGSAALAPMHLSPLVEAMLLRRGLVDAASASAFLNPDSVAPVPFPGMETAVGRLLSAVRSLEPICVWGDFDVDGQSSTALLVEALQLVGARVSYHVPIRATEGHGVGLDSLKTILDNGIKLILTCDTGITAHEAVSYANERGVQVLITDHHDPGDSLPDAFATMNPKLLPDAHPLADLSGVGVAYKLAGALLAARGLDPSPLLDLVAMGLIADLALLRSETRVLAHKGLQSLRRTARLGLRALAEMAESDLDTATEETVGFVLAPRLNALGRLGDANAAVELLLSADQVRVRVLAAQLEGLNTHRKLLTKQVYEAAEEQIAADATLLQQPILILEHASWPGGVLGIVASKFVERYRKPAILLSQSADGTWHGSARSIEALHITKAIAASREILRSFGGHPMAAGLAVSSEHLPQFKSAIQHTAASMLAKSSIQEGPLLLDQWIDLGQLTLSLAEEVDRLAPFGAGNPAPVLATRRVRVISSRQLGAASEHRKLVVVDAKGGQAEVLWWGAESYESPSAEFDLAYSMRPVTYRGERQLALSLVDFRVSQETALTSPRPSIGVVDLRGSAAAVLPQTCLVWAEGLGNPTGVDRYHLRPAQELAIWTSPPGWAEMQAALSAVQPQTVYLIGRLPEVARTLEEFVNRLAGLTKFAIKRRGGKTKISELAAACAQRELAVRIGLQWMVASGHIDLNADAEALELRQGSGKANNMLREELASGLRSLIEETAAYRRHFAIAPAGSLIEAHGARSSAD